MIGFPQADGAWHNATIMWFDKTKGFGFVRLHKDACQVFFHRSTLVLNYNTIHTNNIVTLEPLRIDNDDTSSIRQKYPNNKPLLEAQVHTSTQQNSPSNTRDTPMVTATTGSASGLAWLAQIEVPSSTRSSSKSHSADYSIQHQQQQQQQQQASGPSSPMFRGASLNLGRPPLQATLATQTAQAVPAEAHLCKGTPVRVILGYRKKDQQQQLHQQLEQIPPTTTLLEVVQLQLMIDPASVPLSALPSEYDSIVESQLHEWCRMLSNPETFQEAVKKVLQVAKQGSITRSRHIVRGYVFPALQHLSRHSARQPRFLHQHYYALQIFLHQLLDLCQREFTKAQIDEVQNMLHELKLLEQPYTAQGTSMLHQLNLLERQASAQSQIAQEQNRLRKLQFLGIQASQQPSAQSTALKNMLQEIERLEQSQRNQGQSRIRHLNLLERQASAQSQRNRWRDTSFLEPQLTAQTAPVDSVSGPASIDDQSINPPPPPGDAAQATQATQSMQSPVPTVFITTRPTDSDPTLGSCFSSSSPACRVLPRHKIERVLQGRTERMILVLDGVANLSNRSAIMRSAEALGIQHVWLVAPSTKYKVGQRYRESAGRIKAVSKRVEQWLSIRAFIDPQTCIQALRQEQRGIVVTELHNPMSVPLVQETFAPGARLHLPERFAVIIGNEKDGVSKEMSEAADISVYLPMFGFVESLNVSVASALILQRFLDLCKGCRGDIQPQIQAQLTQQWQARWSKIDNDDDDDVVDDDDDRRQGQDES